MRLSAHYDVICSGGGLPSYVCAALLAKSGRRVLVIDNQDEGFFRTNTDLFPGDARLGAMPAVLRQLGLEAEAEEFKTLEQICQLVFPEFRLSLFSDPVRNRAEIEREFPKVAKDLTEFLNRFTALAKSAPVLIGEACRIGELSLSEQVAARSVLGPYFRSLRAETSDLFSFFGEKKKAIAVAAEYITESILGAFSNAAPNDCGVEQILRSVPLFLSGQSYFPRGPRALKELLLEVIRTSGGDVKRGVAVQSLVSEKSRITGLLLSSHEGIIESDFVVLEDGIHRLYAGLPESVKQEAVLRGLAAVKPKYWRFGLTLTLDEKVFPLGGTENMVFVRVGHSRYEEENFVHVRVLPQDPTQPIVGKVRIFASSFVPNRGLTFDYDHLQRLAGRMCQTLETYIPFLRENLVSVYPDFRRGQQEIRECYAPDKQGEIPEHLWVHEGMGRYGQSFWGVGWATPHRNLYFIGKSIWPSLGKHGEILSARRVAHDIERTRAAEHSRRAKFPESRRHPEALT